MSIVEVVYRLLGAVAPVNQRLSRHRVNLIPANVLLMIGLATAVATSWNTAAGVLRSRQTPQPQRLSDPIFRLLPPPKYVALQGRLATGARIDLGQQGAAGNLELAHYAFVPLVDPATGEAILVQFPADRSFETIAEDATVKGVLRPIVPAVSRQLSRNNYVHAGMPIERRFMLVEGRRPGSLSGPLWIGGIAMILLLSLAWATLTRNVIFMPEERGPLGGVLGQKTSPEPLLVSGKLALDGKKSQFFTNMPAAMQRMDTGDTALVSHIETSSTVFGVKTRQHSGLWVLAIRPGSITDSQAGHVFWGWRKLRAIRFRYVSSMTGKSERAVVASSGDDPVHLFQGC